MAVRQPAEDRAEGWRTTEREEELEQLLRLERAERRRAQEDLTLQHLCDHEHVRRLNTELQEQNQKLSEDLRTERLGRQKDMRAYEAKGRSSQWDNQILRTNVSGLSDTVACLLEKLQGQSEEMADMRKEILELRLRAEVGEKVEERERESPKAGPGRSEPRVLPQKKKKKKKKSHPWWRRFLNDANVHMEANLLAGC